MILPRRVNRSLRRERCDQDGLVRMNLLLSQKTKNPRKRKHLVVILRKRIRRRSHSQKRRGSSPLRRRRRRFRLRKSQPPARRTRKERQRRSLLSAAVSSARSSTKTRTTHLKRPLRKRSLPRGRTPHHRTRIQSNPGQNKLRPRLRKFHRALIERH